MCFLFNFKSGLEIKIKIGFLMTLMYKYTINYIIR